MTPTNENTPKVRPRNKNIAIRVSEEEKALLERRMAQSGISNMTAYLLKMGIDGRIIHVELSSVREMVRLLSNATNNINQIARRTNETGNFHAADMETLKGHYDEIWGQAKDILKRLSSMM